MYLKHACLPISPPRHEVPRFECGQIKRLFCGFDFRLSIAENVGFQLPFADACELAWLLTPFAWL